MRRLRQTLNVVVSLGLLVAAAITVLTGTVALLWDLNDFVYHMYAGYVMTGFAVAHVWLNWRRLTATTRRALGLPPTRSVGRARSPAVGSASTTLPADGAAVTDALIRQGDSGARVEHGQRAPGQPEVVPLPPAPARGGLLSRRGALGLIAGGVAGWQLGRLGAPPTPQDGADLGLLYHRWSSPGVADLFGSVADWGRQSAPFKTYPDQPQITLTPAPPLGPLALGEALAQRRSIRDYSGAPLALGELSGLLAAAAGINSERWGHTLRAAPSAGALYPIEIYPVVHNVAGLSPGVYHYNVAGHSLALLRAGDLRAEVVRQGLAQGFLGACNVVLYLSVIWQRARWKYRHRTYRYALLEAGHLGQNLYLAATALGLGACAVGAFLDDEANALLGINAAEEATVYLIALGSV